MTKIPLVFHPPRIFIRSTFLLSQPKPTVRIPSPWNLRCFSSVELIAGKLTRLLVGARNNGSHNFVVESIDGSLRYPQDFTYYIQNFTALRSEKLVEPGLESTFEYLFIPSETFNGRPMGLVILMNYRNNVTTREREWFFGRLSRII